MENELERLQRESEEAELDVGIAWLTLQDAQRKHAKTSERAIELRSRYLFLKLHNKRFQDIAEKANG